jgi:predicted component of type VI protein secretion system
MTAHATITYHESVLGDEDHSAVEVCRPDRAALRQSVERLLREIFEGQRNFSAARWTRAV